jgi:hypothetical protein
MQAAARQMFHENLTEQAVRDFPSYFCESGVQIADARVIIGVGRRQGRDTREGAAGAGRGRHTREGATERGETAMASDAGYPNIASEIFGMASD